MAKESVQDALRRLRRASEGGGGGDGGVVEFERTDEKGMIRGMRFVNALALNAAHAEESVNLLEFWEVTPATRRVAEKTSTWARITSLEITPENAREIARATRRHWGVENETFSNASANCLISR